MQERATEAHLPETSEFYSDVWLFCTEKDMSLDENYSRFLSLVDVDSLIDWVIMEAYCCNDDLTAGNVRYVRSTEDDGKWRLVFYDLDSSFANPEKNYANLFSDTAVYVQQISKLLDALIRSDDFDIGSTASRCAIGKASKRQISVITPETRKVLKNR